MLFIKYKPINHITYKQEREHPIKKNDLLNSNLFSQPNIPDLQTVKFEFHQAGGNEEMAISFFDKHTATGWMIKSSPIKAFKSLIPSFITNWKKFETNGTVKKSSNAAPIFDRP